MADGVGELNLGAGGQAGSHNILGHVAAHVSGTAIHFAGVLAGKRSAAVTTHAAVGIDNDLAPGQTGVALRPADDETAGRVDEVLRPFVEQFAGQNLLNDFLDAKFFDGSVLHIARVLRGNNHIGDAHWLVVDVLDGYLALGVGPKPLDLAALANAGQLTTDLVRIHDRRGHQLRRFVAGMAEHQALIARSLLGVSLPFGLPRIHTLGDVRTLRCDGIDDEHSVRVEYVVIVRVTDVTNRLPRDGVVIEPCFGRDFAADHHQVAFGVGLTGDATVFVLPKAGVQHSVRNRIANLVRMALADGLRGKDIVLAHSVFQTA